MHFTLLTGVMLLCLGGPCLAQIQNFPPGVSETECRTRTFWVWVSQDFFGSDPWQLEVVGDSGVMDVMFPSRAAQCGYTLTNDVYGNVEIRISFLGCWVKNTNDNKFEVKFQFRLDRDGQISIYPLSMSCLTDSWVVREMVCEENYMEVSVARTTSSTMPHILSTAEPVVGISQSWQVAFNSNAGIPAKDAIAKGYGVIATATRVVFRAPYKTPESQVKKIGNYNIDLLPSNTMYFKTLLRIIVDTTLACPNDPPVFSADALSWLSPTIISPLLSGDVTNKAFYMGINGKLMNETTIEEYNYVFQTDPITVEVTIPYGSPGGYVESDIVNNTYMTMYKINLILQRSWLGVNGDDFTRHTSYKAITAPVTVQIPVFLDHTLNKTDYFNVSLGNFYSDMKMKSFIIHNVPVPLPALGPKQMTVVATTNPNNTRVFYLTVPFSDPLVEQKYLGGKRRMYILYVTYILTHVSKNKNLTYPGVVECVKDDVDPPEFTSSCKNDRMVLTIKRGNMDYYLLPYIRELPLNDALVGSQNITVRSSEAFMYIEVPFTTVGLIHEVVTLSGSVVRLNFTFRSNRTGEVMFSYSFSCPFPPKNLTCLSNGTMIAVIDSTLSKPAFDAQKAHLRDPKCTPQESTSEQALFIFSAFTCWTTRRLEDDYLVYENEVTFDRQVLFPAQPIISRDSYYRLTLRCRYPLKETLWVSAPKTNGAAKPGIANSPAKVLRRRARNHVADLKLAKDEAYATFYHNEDFPVSVQPVDVLYFQAGVHGTEPVAALKDCWATTFPGQDGITRWDLILNGCGAETETFSTEVQTSGNGLPRFKVTLHEAPTSQLFIHCVVVICDAITPPESCPQTCNETRPLQDKRSDPLPSEVVSAGPVKILAHPNGVSYRHVAAETSSSTWTWVLSLGLAVISAFTVAAVFLTIRLFIH
ncbi:hypothetical protein GDO81_023775 [Engystomops pustulosus]|uniref:ZP domain-containing protein n=1 Tax=Engystomops pustulosus TaxID=76066 RepID=A0AAV6Z2C4_ENGPU|nr:hypothetical protein GDO81_023775 [Engystomops pustulosus]